MEAADVVVMNDDLQRDRGDRAAVPAHTCRAVAEHHTGAGHQGVFLVLAVFGSATMWMAIFADMGASLLVVG
jgi:Cd2+/Zn2+-exporting ATPase